MQRWAAAQQIVVELLQYAACLGEQGGGGGDLEVGQGFQKTSTAPSQEQLSCLGSLPLNNCLSVRAHTLTHLANPC